MGNYARTTGREGGGPRALAFQPPAMQKATGPGREQARLWVAGSPGLQAAGCGKAAAHLVFHSSPGHHPTHFFPFTGPGQVEED